MNNKWTIALLLAAMCNAPVLAQTNKAGQSNLNAATLERIIITAAQTANPHVSNSGYEPTEYDSYNPISSVQQQLADETQRQILRNQFYLPSQGYSVPQDTLPQKPLSQKERIEAEEELALIRQQGDNNATFEKYPYLLDASYRRADEETKAQIRKRFEQLSSTQSRQDHPSYYHGDTWARKVGI